MDKVNTHLKNSSEYSCGSYHTLASNRYSDNYMLFMPIEQIVKYLTNSSTRDDNKKSIKNRK